MGLTVAHDLAKWYSRRKLKGNTIVTDLSDESKDEMAATVLQRYRRAREYRDNYILHQGKSALHLMERARRQYDREYMNDDARQMYESFGFTPSRYYGIVQQKCNATYQWKLDLVVTSLDSMFNIQPTPDPDIDDATRDRIREGIRAELLNKMQDAGIVDPMLLVDGRGKLDKRVESFLQEQAIALKQVEQARIVSAAGRAADKAQLRMRDILVEGGFRQAYADFTFDQILFGRGVMRFPHWKVQPIRRHGKSGGITRKWGTIRTFSHINVFNFYPTDDSDTLQDNTGNTERTDITKVELINLARNEAYFKDAIEAIIEDYEYRPRGWLEPEEGNQNSTWWDLDETIPMLIHEGFFSGSELADMGVTGVDVMDYRSARVEIVGGRTIRCELIESNKSTGRTYYQAPFNRIGKGLYDAIGMGAMLWDTEQRVNRLMHIFEHNIDWAARPPIMRNKQAFDNPNDATSIAPNGQYDVEERFASSGSMPDALRTMNTVSAQYHLIMTQVTALLRQADEDCGIPAFAYSSQDFGRSSLGEYSQRMSNALRTIKGLALQEDFHVIEPCFSQIFDDLLDEDRELREGQDINVVVRGMTGLLQEDVKAQRQQQIIPLLLNAEPGGIIPPQAQEYAVRQLLEQAGFPVDALGLSDPIMDNALAVASAMPNPGISAAGSQVPQLDNRSGALAVQNVQGATALNPENLQQTGPIG